MDNKIRKKVNKAIRDAQKTLPAEELPRSDKLSINVGLNRIPKKIRKNPKGILTSFEKTVETKKKKLHSPHSKRTTPGSVQGQPASPAYPHVEGSRWNKSLVLQNKIKSKALVKKLSKKR